MITIPGDAQHRVKINRAIKLSDYPQHPGLHRAALSYIPLEAIAQLPARILAQMINRIILCMDTSKQFERERICEDGHVWDDRRNVSRELSDLA